MKRIIILMLVFVYAFTVSIRANALVSPGDFDSLKTMGWTPETTNIASDGTALRTGAGVAVQGEATALGKISSIVTSPSAKKIAGGLARGLGGALVTSALTILLGKAVDWVLDPANNQVTYKGEPNGICQATFDNGNTYQNVSAMQAQTILGKNGTSFTCSVENKYSYDGPKALICKNSSNGFVSNYGDCNLTDDHKSLDEIAEQIRDMANKGDPVAQKLLEDIVKKMLADKDPEVMDPLVAAAVDDPTKDPAKDPAKDPSKDSTKSATAPTADPTKDPSKDPSTSYDCSSMPIFGKVCDFIDWVKKDPTQDPEEPMEIKDKDKPDFDLPSLSYQPYIQFPANCPNPPTFVVFGQTFAFPIEIFCKFCDELSYVIIAFAWLRALLIVGSGFKGQ